ncbi:MAG: 16S rRNA processing protein RimM, partial [Selenomonas sp.]|nr:16S rRNA processing protein RimM [Selenomonas sp.]
MDSISLKVPVTIKAKLTEKLKTKILADLEEAIKRTELELQQMDIQEKRVMQENQPANPEQPTMEEVQRYQAIQAHFGEERNKRLQFREESLARKEEMEKMVIGAEIV